MKITLIAIAAAALSLGAAGANAATPSPNANALAPAIQFDSADNGVVQVKKGRKFRRKFHGKFHRRHHWKKRHHYGYYHSRCRKFYYLGYVKGYKRYRFLYRRYCRHYRY